MKAEVFCNPREWNFIIPREKKAIMIQDCVQNIDDNNVSLLIPNGGSRLFVREKNKMGMYFSYVNYIYIFLFIEYMFRFQNAFSPEG